MIKSDYQEIEIGWKSIIKSLCLDTAYCWKFKTENIVAK